MKSLQSESVPGSSLCPSPSEFAPAEFTNSGNALRRILLLLFLLLAANRDCSAGGWYVGNTAAGEWIQYNQVWLAGGHYRFVARAGATNAGVTIHLAIDGATVQSGVAVPNTARPDAFDDVYLGSAQVSQGYHTLQVVFETPGVSLDWFMLHKDTDTTNGVKDSDVTMVPPPGNGMLIAPVIGYEIHEDPGAPPGSGSAWVPILPDGDGNYYSDYQLTNWYGVPMYRDFDRRSDRFWDILVDQLLASRAQVPFMHCRGTADFTDNLQDRNYSPGGGWYEGRWLQKLSEAVARNPQAVTGLKLGMFWESGGIADGFQSQYGFYPGWGTPGFVDYCMTNWLEPWLDNCPKELLFQPTPSRPVISFFASTPTDIVADGQMGNFMAQIRERMVERYGMDPLIVLPVGGSVDAPALAQGWGQASWVTWGGPLFTSNYFAGTYWGTASSGSRRRIDTVWMNDWNPVTGTGTPTTEAGQSPGIDSHQPRLDANGNSMMYASLGNAARLGTQLVQEEGFYNISEGNSIFRSYHPEWKYPNQHLAAMRDIADTNTATLMFEAEGCDAYYKLSTNDNTGGTYRREWYRPTTLDVYRPLHSAQGWVQMNAGPNAFVQMNASFWDVWALDNKGSVWAQSATGDGNSWQQVSTPQAFTCVSPGKLYAWGIAGTTVYSTSLQQPAPAWVTTGWTQQSGSMVQLSVGNTEVWAVDADGNVYRRLINGANNWVPVNGTFDNVSVGDAFVWGMKSGHIYYAQTTYGITSSNNTATYPSPTQLLVNEPTNVTWTECPNPYGIIKLSVGSDEVWGLDAGSNVYRLSASGAGNWDLMDGSLSLVAVGDGYVWGLSGSKPVYRRLEGFAQTGAPSVPYSPKVTPGNARVSLYWNAVTGAATYNLKRATTSGGPYTTIASLLGATYNFPFADTNVANGTTYYYVISAVNAAGESPNSGEVIALPQSTPPAPGSLSASAASATQINLGWSNNSANNYGVSLERILGTSGAFTEIARALGAGVTNFSDTQVVYNTQYSYRVRAFNAAGYSPYSAQATATTSGSLTGTGSGTIVREVWNNIQGTAVSAIPTNTTPNQVFTLTSLVGPVNEAVNYGARVRGYLTAPVTGNYTFWIASDDASELMLSTDSQAANKVVIASVAGWTDPEAWTWFSSQQSAPIFLNGGLTYYLEVLHKQGGGGDNLAVGWTLPGLSLATNNIQIIPGSQLTPYSTVTGSVPAAPSGLAATAVSGVQVNLSWANNATNQQRFEIYRAFGPNAAFTQVGEVAANATNYTDSYLLPTTGIYSYKVCAGNAAGNSAFTPVVTVSTLPVVPAAPNNLVAVAASTTQINLAWQDAANNETGYSVERKTGAGGIYSEIGTAGTGATNYDDTKASATTNFYYYRVRAANAVGYSPYSNEGRAATLASTPAPPAPGALAAIGGNSQVELIWSAYTGADSYDLQRSLTANGPYTTIQSGVTSNSFDDLAVTNGIRYYYVVSGVSGGNAGGDSIEASALSSVVPIFTNTQSGNWSTAVWSPNPPGQPFAGTQTALIFANGSPVNSTNDLGSFTLNQLLFAGQSVNLAGNPLVFDGATPSISNAQNSASTVANPVTLNQATAFVISSNAVTFSGGIGGAGALGKNGAGVLVLVGTNNYGGQTTINNGILQLGNGASNGSVSGSLLNNSPAPGGLCFDNATAQTNSATISGPGSVAKTGAGTLTWNFQSAYTNLTLINGGIIFNAGGVNGLGASWSPVDISSNATWSFNGISASVGTLSLTNGNCGTSRSGNLNFTNLLSSGSSSVGVSEMKIGADQSGGSYTAFFSVADGTLTLNVNKLYDFSTAIGGIVKAGSGTLRIANLGTSYKGPTTISGGILQVSLLANGGIDSHIGQSSNPAPNLVLNGGALQYTGPAVSSDRLFSLGTNGGTLDASGTGAFALGNPGSVGFVDSGPHNLTLTGTSAGTNSLSATLADNGGATSLTKTGAGSWTLNSANTHSGGTTVASGKLTLAAAATLGAGNLTVSNGATCSLQGVNALAGGAYVYLNGTLNLASSGTNTASRLYIGGALQPAGLWNAARNAAHFTGAGTLNITTGSATGPILLNLGSASHGGIQLTWTNTAVELYYTPSLTAPPAWTPVTNQPLFTNGQWTVTLPIGSNQTGFYRLQQ